MPGTATNRHSASLICEGAWPCRSECWNPRSLNLGSLLFHSLSLSLSVLSLSLSLSLSLTLSISLSLTHTHTHTHIHTNHHFSSTLSSTAEAKQNKNLECGPVSIVSNDFWLGSIRPAMRCFRGARSFPSSSAARVLPSNSSMLPRRISRRRKRRAAGGALSTRRA
jgi:hypothetical protein